MQRCWYGNDIIIAHLFLLLLLHLLMAIRLSTKISNIFATSLTSEIATRILRGFFLRTKRSILLHCSLQRFNRLQYRLLEQNLLAFSHFFVAVRAGAFLP